MILLTMVENRCKGMFFISLSPDNVVADILGEEKTIGLQNVADL